MRRDVGSGGVVELVCFCGGWGCRMRGVRRVRGVRGGGLGEEV